MTVAVNPPTVRGWIMSEKQFLHKHLLLQHENESYTHMKNNQMPGKIILTGSLYYAKSSLFLSIQQKLLDAIISAWLLLNTQE